MIRLELDNNRRFTMIAIAIVVFVFFFVLFLPKKQIYRGHLGADSITYSYEMPRTQSAEVPFDLSNREVVQRYNQNPQANPEATVTTAPVPAAKVAQDKAKKAADAKKKAAKKDDKKDPKAQGKRAKMKVDVTNTSRTSWTANSTPDASDAAMSGGSGYWASPGGAQAQGATTDPNNPQDDNIDVSTWLSMLQNHPSSDIIQKFLKARNAGQIGDGDFYRIVSALLQDGASDRQKAGVSILSADVSPSTYEFLVVKANSFSGDVQSQLKALLNSYATAKFLVLGRVLASSQTKAVLQSALGQLAQVVSASKAPTPPTTGGTTGVSGQATTGVSAAQLMSFTGVLQKLAKNSDSSIASQAQTILTQIQALTKTTT